MSNARTMDSATAHVVAHGGRGVIQLTALFWTNNSVAREARSTVRAGPVQGSPPAGEGAADVWHVHGGPEAARALADL